MISNKLELKFRLKDNMKFKSLETKLKSFFRNNPFELHFEEDEKQGTVDVFGDVSEDILKNLDKNFDNFKRF